MKTKLLKPIWLAAMLLLLSSVPLTANAHDFEVGGIYYLIDGTNATVTFRGSSYNEYSNEYSGNVVIPESVTYNGSTYSVTSIGPYAFRDCSGLTRVTIGNSVTSIGKYAFYNCTGLTSVTIPNSVTSIGNNAFYKCSGLTSITIPNSVTSIGDYAFQNCSGLTGELVIPNSVTSIGNNAFNRCSGLTSVTIGNSVTSIGNYAFYQCSGLTSVTIGNSVTSIGYGAFYGCSGLTSVNIPNSVTSIGISAFSHCSGLTSVTIGNSVTSIGDYAFAYCSGLTGELVIPNSVTSIGNYAFSGCSGLTSVTIPNLVTSIGSSAFQGCSGLTRVETLIENPASVLLGSNVFSSINPLCKLVVPHGTINAYRQADQWKNFLRIIDDTFDPTQYIEFEDQEVERICINNWDSDGDGFLSYNEAASVTSLGEVFKDNETITSFNELQYFTGLTSIGNYAFNNCSGLTSITIPNSVTSIGERAFYRCSGLTSIDIPNSVISIGKDAFQLCSGLTSVHITDLAAWCNITFGDNLANPLYYAHHLFLNGAEVTDLVIPNSVTSIGNSAFQGCSGLTSVTIPNSVTSIGYNAFIECSGLESIVVENGNSTYDSRDNCNAIIETATNTLISGCKNTIIPNSVTSIGSSAFSRCTGLTSVTIPNSVTSIGDVAFQQCYGLTSVTIPNSVTSIGNYAFNYCGGLTSIYNHINHPTNVTLGSNVFYGVSKTNCTLYVTAGRVNEYRNANQWKDFVNIVEGDWLGDISFENDFLTLYLGETDTLQVQLTPASAPYPTLLWQSSDTTVATVDQNGRITPITLGQTVITATTTTTDDGLNLSASCTVYVRAHVSSISLDKDSTILYLNETDTLTATVLPEFAYNKVVNWTSSDANVATVDQNGVVTAHAVGNAIITATTTDGTSLSDSCLVEVRAYATGITLDKTQTSIYVGGNDSIAATVLPENAYNKTLLWQSSDTTVATVDQNGKVTAVALGQAVITASTTDGTNLSASCQVNVTGITSIALNKTSTNIYVSGTETLTASIVPSDVIINTLQWQSSDTTVATVDQNGKVTAVALGQAVITAMAADGSGVSASCQVNVTGITRVTLSNSSAILYLNNTQQLYATITPSDVIVKTLVWQSSDPAVATVDQNGKVTAHTVGTAIITATTTDGTNLSASCQVTVWPQYALAAPGIEHTRGEQSLVVEYAVEMFNKNAITGLQFEMQLPDSISLMDDSYGYPDIWLDENRRARNHSVDVTELGDNYYKVMISSPTNKEFKGNSGNLFYMRLLVDKYHASGIYNIGLTGIVLAEPDETEHQVDDTSFDVQYNYMLGDADADVRVDVGDYITTALYIMNRPTLRFYEDAANVHTANDAINVTDLTGITNIALGIRPTEILHAPALGDAALADNNEPELGVSVKRLDADRWMMSVDLSNRQPMAAMQLDLQLPDGVSYESASLTERAGKLQLTDGILPDGTLRLLMSAFSADDIEAGEGDVINIVLKGNPVAGGMATFHNMIVAERNLNSYEPEPMMVPFVPTAIDGATLYNEVRIYGEKGNVVIESPVAGTAQLVLLNGIATPLEVQPGRNTYPVNSNEYYIVRFNGVTAKLRF